jgi:hypothetical protein
VSTLEDIRILIEPHAPVALSTGALSATQRRFDEYDRLAEELQRNTSARVSIVECWLGDAPRDGMLLAAYHPAMEDVLLAPGRPTGPPPALLAINVDYKLARTLAEQQRIAGAIATERYVRWLHGQEDIIFRQIIGLKALAAALAPALEPGSMIETEEYCLYRSADALALPAMLARYIDAYWQHYVDGASGA